jgi:hypothetical protein
VVDARVLRARQCLLFQTRCCHACCRNKARSINYCRVFFKSSCKPCRERCHRMYIRTSVPRLTCAHCRHSFSDVRDLLRATRHVRPPGELRARLLSWYALSKVSCSDLTLPECIRNWRATLPENPTSENELKKTSKTCPMCRSQSDFIIPSSIWPIAATNENPMKKEIVERYLGRLRTIPCKHFEKSINDSAPPDYKFKCQFGNHCHYSHAHPITKEPYIFSEEELQRRRKPRMRAQMLDEMAIIEMLFNNLTADDLSTDDDGDGDEFDEVDDFEDHIVFEAELFGLSDDFDDFRYDYRSD